jgi:hypothetical protein
MYATFPNFSKLTIDDKEEYQNLFKAYPCISDIEFATLMIWWNLSDELSISLINGNVVILYVFPLDQDNSGLCLVGNKNIDESINEIFEYQKRENLKARLVHVPEFTINEIKERNVYNIESERDYDEYIIEASSLEPISNSDHSMRRKVNKFIKEAGEENISVSQMDLSDKNIQESLIETINEWDKEYSRPNDREGAEKMAIKISINLSQELNIENLCVYVNKKLQGFGLFNITADGNYLIVHHLKVRYEIPRIFDYVTQQIAKFAVDNNVKYVNLEMDLGIEGLRQHKMELHPVDFLRKYKITPKLVP